MARRYLFSASAAGFSARLTAPIQHDTGVLAASTLSVSGGHCAARVENVRIGEIVSLGAVSTQVTGIFSAEKQAWETLTMATLEKLNVLDVVTVDRISVRVVSHYPLESAEPSILPLGTAFENLRIAGSGVKVNLDTGLFSEISTWSALRKRVESDPELDKRIAATGEDPKVGLEKGLVMCSLARSIDAESGGIAMNADGMIEIPHFGRLYLAQYVMSPAQRRLTMLRVELGCPVEGGIEGGDVAGNGNPYPP
ncbi:MAG: hypothetical protein MUC42_07980 [Bryobacter sp.]|jgi:hypothetical protein|nr:hypothetical protein [Bryobacter sp.]